MLTRCPEFDVLLVNSFELSLDTLMNGFPHILLECLNSCTTYCYPVIFFSAHPLSCLTLHPLVSTAEREGTDAEALCIFA